MDLDLLRTFVAVADARSFTKAAGRVHRTQSTISQQVARLEERLERPLFLRDRRRVALTEHGEQYLAYARRMLALDEESRAVINAPDPIAFLRLGVTEDFAVTRLPAVLHRLVRHHRNMRLEVVSNPSAELRARFEAGEMDLVVLKELEPQGADIVLRWQEQPSWVIKTGDGATLRSERPVPLIASKPGCVYRIRATSALDAMGVGWRIAYESGSWSGIKAAVESGFGVSLLADTLALRNVRRLTARDGFPPVKPVHLVLRARETPLKGMAADIAAAMANLVASDRAVARL